MLVAESATMASECAVLGVPSVYVAKTSRGYIDEQSARYDLVHIFDHSQEGEAMAKALELAADPQLGPRAAAARARLLDERIDVTKWMVDFFSDPASQTPKS
jgi:predicted glycosyltransferase